MPIDEQDRKRLVALARSAVAAEAAGGPPPPVGPLQGLLAEKRGCFVTLTNQGHLRGCIGTFQPQLPLAELVVEMGAAAACDSRFISNPVTPQEVPQLTVEVSVLSPLELTADPLQLQVGRHGIYIIRGSFGGCFLPEVATDMGWNAEEFLTECCSGKAHMAPDAWRQPGTKVFLFTSEKFAH